MLDNVTERVPQWAAVFLPEFDGYTRDIDPDAYDYNVFRHYPGEGSFSMAWVINPSFFQHLSMIGYVYL